MSSHAGGKWWMKTGQNRPWLGTVVALPPLVDVMFMQQKFKYGRSGHNLKTVLTIHMAYSSKTHDIIRDIIIFFFGWKKNHVETANVVPILILERKFLVLLLIFLFRHFPSLFCFGDENSSCFPVKGTHFLFYLETVQPLVTPLSLSPPWVWAACEHTRMPWLCALGLMHIDLHWQPAGFCVTSGTVSLLRKPRVKSYKSHV